MTLHGGIGVFWSGRNMSIVTEMQTHSLRLETMRSGGCLQLWGVKDGQVQMGSSNAGCAAIVEHP